MIGRLAILFLQQPAGGAPAPPLAANNKFFGRFEQDTRAPAMKLAASPENSHETRIAARAGRDDQGVTVALTPHSRA